MRMEQTFVQFSNRTVMSAMLGAAGWLALAAPLPASAAPAGEVQLAALSGPTLAETVAASFSRAAEASARADSKALASELQQIAATGARPLGGDGAGSDPVARWRTMALADKTAPMRGSPLGPGYRAGQVDPGSQERFEQLFLSGRKASIALSSPGNAPLALIVLDANLKPVCAAQDARLACHWMPLFTQRYTIEVRNKGARTADYFLVVE